MITNKAQGQTLKFDGTYQPWLVLISHCQLYLASSLSTDFDFAFVIIQGRRQRVGNERLISDTLYIDKYFKVCNI